jgi:hypothetical protein
MNDATIEIGFRIYPTHVVQFPVVDKSLFGPTNAQLKNRANLLDNKPAGLVSKKADKRIRNSVNWLVASALKKRIYSKRDKRTYVFTVNFVTLTLPSLDHGITDSFFKSKLLKKFLARMNYQYGLKNYVWKVETQANGNIHAHITSDCFMHYLDIRSAWNDILINAGLMKSFASKHGHSDPNSTDIHSVHSVKDLAAYLAKYFSKNDMERRQVDGKLWASSYSLSDRNACNIYTPPSDDDHVIRTLVDSQIEYMKIEGEPNTFGRRPHVATVYFMDKKAWQSISGSAFQINYSNRLREIRNGVSGSLDLSLKFDNYANSVFNAKAAPSRNLRSDGQSPDGVVQPPSTQHEIYAKARLALQLDLFQTAASPLDINDTLSSVGFRF